MRAALLRATSSPRETSGPRCPGEGRRLKAVRAVVGPEELEAVTAPRDDLVLEGARPAEREPGDSRHRSRYSFDQLEGPLRAYQRTVEVTTLDHGRFQVDQSVQVTVGLPWWSWLLALPVRAHLRRLPGPGSAPPRRPDAGTGAPGTARSRVGGGALTPWWAPPARLDRRSATVLAVLAALSAVQGLVSGLLPVTLTFAATEFHRGTFQQGTVFALAQLAAIPALAALVLADKRGRRRVVLWCSAGAVLASELSAFSPNLAFLAGGQVVAGVLLGAASIATVVVAVEEVPAGARAWSVGVLAMSVGLGAGVPLALLPVAGVGPGGWRWMFAASALCLPVVAVCARQLPESRRWQHGAVSQYEGVSQYGGVSRARGRARRAEGPVRSTEGRVRSTEGRAWRPRGLALAAKGLSRLALVCTGAFAFAVFSTPALAFQTQFLVTDRHYSAAAVSVLEQLAGTVGGLGTLVSGRLADTRGRRPVGAVCVAGSALFMLITYTVHGWPMWPFDTFAQLFAYGVTPVLGVYGAELFATSSRAAKAGLVSASAAVGGTVGLVAMPALAGGPHHFAGALAVLAIGPAILVLLLATRFPETAGEDLGSL